MNTAHQVFRIDELLHEIFEQLAFSDDSAPPCPGPEKLGARAPLLSAALCSRSFCEPALDVLWNRLDNLYPLLWLLPPFRRVAGLYTLSRPLEKDDWTRFDQYAKRVRLLDLPTLSFSPWNFDSRFYHELSTAALTRLPNLRAFAGSIQMPSTTVRRLATLPNLYELALDADRVDWAKVEEESTLDAFRQLRFAWLQGNVDSVNLALDLINSPHLQILHLKLMIPYLVPSGKLTSPDLDLAKFGPSLISLTITGSIPTFPPIRPILSLHNLRSVQLGGDDERDLDLIDQDVGDMARAWPELTHLVLRSTHIPYVECLSHLAYLCLRLQALSINLAFSSSLPSAEEHYYFTPSNASLESLSINYRSPAQDRDEIANFVTALFPRVEELTLEYGTK